MTSQRSRQRLAGKKAAATKRLQRDRAVIALSVRQPFAEQILRGEKTIEYRRLRTHVRGRVYLYAGRQHVEDQDLWKEADAVPGDLPTGVLVGTVEIVGCRGRAGNYEWDLARPVRFERPIAPDRQPQPIFFRPFETHGVDESIIQRPPFSVFSWGFHGWGNSTDTLIQTVDAVERNRGFKPPLFVEVRIQRSGRAVGFNGSNFEALLGSRRYSWISDLGNKGILDGGPIRLKDPHAAQQLLNLAVEAIDQRRRVIFYCGCKNQKEEGRIRCHRWVVGKYLLAAAARAGMDVSLEEWPGGEPEHIDLAIPPSIMQSLRAGREYLPLGPLSQPARFAGLSHGTCVTAASGSDKLYIVAGPAVRRGREWALPAWNWFDAEEYNISAAESAAASLRERMGWTQRH